MRLIFIVPSLNIIENPYGDLSALKNIKNVSELEFRKEEWKEIPKAFKSLVGCGKWFLHDCSFFKITLNL